MHGCTEFLVPCRVSLSLSLVFQLHKRWRRPIWLVCAKCVGSTNENLQGQSIGRSTDDGQAVRLTHYDF